MIAIPAGSDEIPAAPAREAPNLIMPHTDWPLRFLDDLGCLAGVVNKDGTFLFANRAVRALHGSGSSPVTPCRSLLAVVQAVLGDRRERRGVIVESHGARWRGRAWPFGPNRVAFLASLEPAASGGRAKLLAERLGIEVPEARLALWVAGGRSNQQIAARLGVPAGTVNSRLWRLYRKLGVRNRAELATRVMDARDPGDANGWS